MMTKLDAALLKLEGALDYTTDPRVRTLIDTAQQAIEMAKQVTVETLQCADEYGEQKEEGAIACLGRYQQAA